MTKIFDKTKKIDIFIQSLMIYKTKEKKTFPQRGHPPSEKQKAAIRNYWDGPEGEKRRAAASERMKQLNAHDPEVKKNRKNPEVVAKRIAGTNRYYVAKGHILWGKIIISEEAKQRGKKMLPTLLEERKKYLRNQRWKRKIVPAGRTYELLYKKLKNQGLSAEEARAECWKLFDQINRESG